MRIVNAVIKTLWPQVPQHKLLQVQQEVYNDVGRCLDNRKSAVKKNCLVEVTSFYLLISEKTSELD